MGFHFAGFSREVYPFWREVGFLAIFYVFTADLLFLLIEQLEFRFLVEFYGIYLPSYHIIKILHRYILTVSASSWFLCTKGCNRVCIML